MATQQKNKAIEQIRKDFQSDDEGVVLAALGKCRDSGDVSIIEPLLTLYGSTESMIVRQEAADMLGSLKVRQSEAAFVAALGNPRLRDIRKDILAFMWNSGVQPVDDLAFITRIAIDGDYGETLECLTLLESMDAMAGEEQLLESITSLKQYLGNSVTDHRTDLLRAYLVILQSMRESEDQ